MRAARPWGIVAAGAVVALTLAGPARAAAPEITPITAVFVPAELATKYTVATTGTAPADATYTWTLHLTLVDPAGAPAPGLPDSGAAVDPTCDNAHLPGGSAAGGDTFVWKKVGSSFTWFHGDKGSYPDGYGCDHTKMGPSGHQGVVTVVVATSKWSCTATIPGTNLTQKPQTGTAPVCKELAASTPPPATTAETATAATTTAQTATTTSSSSGGFPIWVPIVIVAGLLAAAAAWWFFGRATAADPCAELVARCKELRAKAATAAQGAADAAAKAKAAETAYEQAKAAREKAESAANAADHPDEGESWIEDADTGERITEHDLALEKGDGGSHWGDPAYRAQLRAQEKARAHASLDAAKQAEADAKSAADSAAAATTAAAGAAATAQADADAACKAADDCVAAAAAAKKAAEDEERRKQAETPHTVERQPQPPAPPPPPPPPSTPPPTTVDGGTPGPPSQPPKPPIDPHDVDECEDGCDPDVQTSSIDLELFLVWAADIQIDGAFEFSEDDVESALSAFENFKAVVDIAEFAEGFAESGGDLVSGSAGVDAILNTFTTGLDQGFSLSGQSNIFDPSSYGEDQVMDALKKLIEKVNPKRALGTWTMKCPLVHVHVTCTRVKECRNGRWVLTSHTLSVEYGKPIRYESTSADNWDYDNPGRGAIQTKRTLLRHFEYANRAGTKKLQAFAKACAAAK
jgi:hypothetical protein